MLKSALFIMAIIGLFSNKENAEYSLEANNSSDSCPVVLLDTISLYASEQFTAYKRNKLFRKETSDRKITPILHVKYSKSEYLTALPDSQMAMYFFTGWEFSGLLYAYRKYEGSVNGDSTYRNCEIYNKNDSMFWYFEIENDEPKSYHSRDMETVKQGKNCDLWVYNYYQEDFFIFKISADFITTVSSRFHVPENLISSDGWVYAAVRKNK